MSLHVWRIANLPDATAHSYPLDDDVDHDPDPGCVCGPTRIDAQRRNGDPMDLYVHHSLNGYEVNP